MSSCLMVPMKYHNIKGPSYHRSDNMRFLYHHFMYSTFPKKCKVKLN